MAQRIRVITIRISPALHAGLGELAHISRTSVNKLATGLIEQAITADAASCQVYAERIEREAAGLAMTAGSGKTLIGTEASHGPVAAANPPA